MPSIKKFREMIKGMSEKERRAMARKIEREIKKLTQEIEKGGDKNDE